MLVEEAGDMYILVKFIFERVSLLLDKDCDPDFDDAVVVLFGFDEPNVISPRRGAVPVEDGKLGSVTRNQS